MATWMIPYEKLDPAQKDFVNNYDASSGNKWVLGYAGSGKSILLVHLLKRLKDESDRNHNGETFGVVAFTRALGDLFKTGFQELGISGVPIMTQFDLRRNPQYFDYLFCDEIQDLSPETLAMVKSSAKRVIAAGDTNQSIYGLDPLSQTRPVKGDEPVTVLGATKKELNIIYRLTQSIIAAVKKLMPHMSQNWTAMEDLTRVDVQIELRKAINLEKECAFVYEDAKKCCSRGERTAILFPKHDKILFFVNQILRSQGKTPWTVVNDSYGKPNYAVLNSYFARQGIPMMYIGNNYGSLSEAQQKDLIIIMTYSSSKGLDFENVYLPFAERGLFITTDAQRDRVTFMVAMTRSSHYLTVSYTGTPSEYIDAFRDNCHFTDEANIQRRATIDLF